jgi:small-conductance mechanosensitive channel
MHSQPDSGSVARGAGLILLLFCCAASGAAQQVAPDSLTPEPVVQAPPGVPVVLGGDTLFYLYSPLGPYATAQRAESTRDRLLDAARNPFLRRDSLTVVEAEGRSDVMLGEQVLTTVTEGDAAAEGLTREEVAHARAAAITSALERTSLRTNLRALLVGAVLTLLVTVLLYVLLRLVGHVFPRVQRLLRLWQRRRLHPVRVQNLEVVSAERIGGFISGMVTLLRLVVTLLLLYVWLLLVFSFFPWTRGMASALAQYATDPIIAVLYSFVAFVPDLFSIIVIIVATYYLLKLVRLIFDGIGSGAITLHGFYADWADTTYKIVRLLIIVMSVILIWPFLPASETPQFRGVAAFLGLLLSLGSASAVANVVGGVVMVYMRPFQIGDRVKIADTVGDVVEKTLLVTRIRTPKNVEVTIPNSMVLGSHLVNYSTTARTGGLILHTTITLGYDLPWRRVHDVLIEAALATDGILPEPRPFVLQTALNDFHVSYELNAYTDRPGGMARTYSELHQNVQDACAAAGIEILSPLYAATRDGSASTIPQ